MAARLGRAIYWVLAVFALLNVSAGIVLFFFIAENGINAGAFTALGFSILSALIIWAVGLSIDYILAGPEGKLAQYRFRWRVRNHLNSIFQMVRPKLSKHILIICFGRGWRSELRIFENRGEPREVASVIAGMAMERLAGLLTQDRRDMALFALRSGNTSNYEANNFLSVLEGIRALTGDGVYLKFAMQTLVNALEHQGPIRMNRTLGEIWADVIGPDAET
jgi:hypothetical protein